LFNFCAPSEPTDPKDTTNVVFFPLHGFGAKLRLPPAARFVQLGRPSAWVLAAIFCLGVALFHAPALAQATAPKVIAPVASPIVALDWKDLTPVQRVALAPLEAAWPKLAAGQKRKWIAVVQNFSQLSEPERSKVHSRMAEWAALNPRERQTARLNFAATKKLTPSEKSATWEAYQALSPEDKKVLAKKGPPLASSTAIAAKPASSNVITPVPVTRNSTSAQRKHVASQQAIDPHTLLPLTPKY
jgi:hypothetical protein